MSSANENWRITAAVLCYNSREIIGRTLEHLTSVPGLPIVMADNGSSDGTVEYVRERFPEVRIVTIGKNIGAAARNRAVEAADTPYVAFCDDDTWWEPGSLRLAVELFDAYPNVAILNAKILIGPQNRVDPISHEMSQSPVHSLMPLPGHALLSYMAGASAARRDAFLAHGGYNQKFFIGGEEELLAWDLAADRWHMRYIPDLVVHHYPSNNNAEHIRHAGLRNTLMFAWLRRSPASAWRWTRHMLAIVPKRKFSTWRGLFLFAANIPYVIMRRHTLPGGLEEQIDLLDEQKMNSKARRYEAAPAAKPAARRL